jgi:hypothetical protein
VPPTKKTLREATYKRGLSEIREGITRWNVEWPTEVKARLVLAAKARGVWPAVLLRAIAIDWLNAHALVPVAVGGPPMEVSAAAYDTARSLKDGNALMEAHYGPSEAKLGEIFGFNKPKELAK